MKKIFAATALCILTATSAFAAEETRPYVSINAGLFIPSDSTLTDNAGYTAKASFDKGFAISGAFGAALQNNLRLECEIAHRKASMKELNISGISANVDSDISALSFMFNGFYDFKNTSTVTPYIGGGIGFSDVGVGRGTYAGRSLWTSEDKTVFSYQIGVGVGLSVTPNAVVDLGYRYFGTSDVDFDMAKATFDSHNLMVGLRYLF